MNLAETFIAWIWIWIGGLGFGTVIGIFIGYTIGHRDARRPPQF